MERHNTLLRRVLAFILSFLMFVTLMPAAPVMAATGYTIHYVDRLTNPDGFYNNYVDSGNREYVYLTDIEKIPSITINNSDFKTGKSSTGAIFIYTSASHVPTTTGHSAAKVWNNVASFTYKNAGYLGKDKTKSVDLILTLDKVVCMRGWYTRLDNANYPYYSPAGVEPSVGLWAHSYCHNSKYEYLDFSPYTVENWSIKLVDKSGNIVNNSVLVQTYKDIDVYRKSNDTSYTPTFAEGFVLLSGFAKDTYLRKDYQLDIYNAENMANSAYRATTPKMSDSYDYQPHWFVAAILDGSAKLQWAGEDCGSLIANSVITTYPTPDKPTKSVDKSVVKPLEEFNWTVTMDYPDTNVANAPSTVKVTDTFDDILEIKSDKIKVYDKNDKDVTSEWSKTIEGQTVTLTANNPALVSGKYRYVYPTVVKKGVLDGKTLVVVDGMTYAEIPNTATVSIKANAKDLTLTTPPVIVRTGEAAITLTKDVDKKHIDDPKVGDKVAYTFTISNTGTFTLHDIDLKDALPVKDLKVKWETSTDSTTAEGILSPGEGVTGTAYLELAQSDIDAGLVHNTATVTGTDPKGEKVTDDDSADTTLAALPPVPDPKKECDKEIVKANENVTWEWTEEFPTYSDTSLLKDVKTTDTMDSILSVDADNITVLDESGNDVTSSWTVTVDGQKVTITANKPASVSGKTFTFKAVTKVKDEVLDGKTLVIKDGQTYAQIPNTAIVYVNDDPHTSNRVTVLIPASKISLTKSADKKHISDAVAGDKLNYGFKITNPEKTTLHDVKLADGLPVENLKIDWASSSDPSTEEGVLSPKETVNATAEYTLTDKDIAAGKVVNTATVTGIDPKGNTVTADAKVTTTLSEKPPVPDPKKDRDKETVEPNGTITWTIEEEFPEYSDASSLKNVSVSDTMNEILSVNKAGIIVKDSDGTDVTSAWTSTVNGQNVLIQANDPASVNGKTYTFSIPTTVKDTAFDGLTLVVKEGQTYAEIPNTAVVTVNDDPHSSNTVTTLVPASGISVKKDVDKAKIENAKPGDLLNYTFQIKNTKNVTLTGVVMTDSLPVKDLTVNWPASSDSKTGEGVLSPGETVTGSAKYEVTQADILAGKVHNVVTVTGTDPQGNKVTDEDDADTVLTAKAAITLSKTANPNSMTNPSVGDLVEYSFEIANPGNVDLTDIVFNDDHELIGLTWDKALSDKLAPNAVIKGTAKYALTQADIDAGELINKASVTGTGANGEKVEANDQDTTVIKTTPAIQLEKTTPVAILTDAKAGVIVQWNFKVKNVGKNTLSGVNIVDHLEGVSEITYDWAGSSDSATGDSTLSPDEEVTATATYTLADADIIAKEVINTATAHGTDPSGTEVTADAEAKVQIKYEPKLTLTKDADREDYTGMKAGDIINYTLSLTNDGNIILTNVELSDLKEGAVITGYNWPSEEGVLNVGETVTASVEYTLTHADIDMTELENDAEGKGQAPDGEWVYATVPNIITREFNPAIALDKDVDIEELKNAKPGDVLNYTVTVTNIGDATLDNIVLTDSLDDVLFDKYFEGRTTSLVQNEGFVMTAKYAVTQADIDAGEVINEASVTGTDPEGTQVSANDDAKTVIEQVAADAVTKKASTTKVSAVDAKPGYEVGYDFTAENTGNSTLHEVTFTDEMLKAAGVDIEWNWREEGVLLPGEVITGKAAYALTQADIDAGKLTNVIIMNAKDPSGNPLDPQEATAETIIEAAPAMEVTKVGDKTVLDPAKAGDAVKYDFTATNTGNVTIHEVTFTDELLDTAGVAIKWNWKEEGILLPGETITGTSDAYTVTQADIDAGKLTNVIIMNAKDPSGNPVDPQEAEFTTVLTQDPSHKVTKTVDKEKIEKAVVGEKVKYAFTYENDGNTSLHDIEFTDELLTKAGVEIAWDWSSAKTEGILFPGEAITGEAEYTITQADIDNKGMTNTIIANAKDPGGDPLPPSESTVETVIQTNPAIVLTKDVDVKEIKDAKVGDLLKYGFKLENAGDTTLLAVVINDQLKGIKDVKIDWTSSSDEATGEGVLSPGETVTGTASYEVTQADIDAGKVLNVAFATGYTPGDPDEPVNSPEDDAETILGQTAKIILEKTVDITLLTDPEVGKVLTYTFKITNGGNVTLHDGAIIDSLTGKGLSGIVINFPHDGKSIAPGESATGTATYALTAADIKAGKVVNTAKAKGKDPSGSEIVSDEATVTTSIKVTPKPGTTTVTTGKTSTVTPSRSTTTTVSAPKTGDNSWMTIAAIVFLLSAAVLVYQYRKRKA